MYHCSHARMKNKNNIWQGKKPEPYMINLLSKANHSKATDKTSYEDSRKGNI